MAVWARRVRVHLRRSGFLSALLNSVVATGMAFIARRSAALAFR
jgi:hypothetical protein